MRGCQITFTIYTIPDLNSLDKKKLLRAWLKLASVSQLFEGLLEKFRLCYKKIKIHYM